MADSASPLRGFAAFAVMVAVPAVAAVVLHTMGRRLWCQCGSWIPWSWDVWSQHNSQHLLDPYAFTHLLHGVAFYGALWLLLGRRLSPVWQGAITAALESGWEILENSPLIIERYRAATISLDYFGDSVINSMADVGVCLLGLWVASKLPWKWSLVLFFVTELVLLLWVRDSLLVNILQLVYPIEAVKTWQMGH